MVEVQRKKHAQNVAWTFAHTLAPESEIEGNKLIVPRRYKEQIEAFVKAIGGQEQVGIEHLYYFQSTTKSKKNIGVLMCKFKNSLPTNHPYYQVSEDNYHNSLADTKSTLYCFFAMNDTKLFLE